MAVKILSVIVPSYNMENYLPKCLGSLLVAPELMERLEVLVVNDGSKDRTSEVGHEFAAKWPGTFKVIDKQNGNYGSCFNAALKIATGLYVKSLDADDSYDNEALRKYLGFLCELSTGDVPDVVFNDFVDVSPDGTVGRLHSYSLVGHDGFSFDDFCRPGSPDIWHCAIAYRLELLKKINYKQSEGIFYTDQQWDMIPMLSARSVAYCPCALYNYLIGRPDQSCNERVRLKNFSMHIPMEKAVVAAYSSARSSSPQSNLMVVERQILTHAQNFYYYYLIRYSDILDGREISEFDDYISAVAPELYRKMDSISCCGVLRFHYVTEWRRRRTTRTLKFLACKLIKKIIAVLKPR